MFESINLSSLDTLREIENERIQIAELDDVSRWIELASSSIPTLSRFQNALLKIEEYFEESGLEGDDLHLWRAYRDLFAQRYSGVYDDILEVTDVIAYDLFQYFIQHENLKTAKSRYTKDAIPLTFLGRTEDYYFTYTHDMERPVAVISIPQGRVSSVWNWLAIPHEIGHNIFAHFIHFEEELFGKISAALENRKFTIKRVNIPNSISGRNIIKSIWHFWLDELIADVFGVLFAGPSFVMSRHEDSLRAAWDMGGLDISYWKVKEMEMSKHPTAFIRPLLGGRILNFLGFEKIAETLDARWRTECAKLMDVDELRWIDITEEGEKELFKISVEQLLDSFDIILPIILNDNMKCLGGVPLSKIIRFDNLDHVISRVVSEELLNQTSEFARFVKPRHILAASRMAFESCPDSADLIHASAMQGLIYFKNNHMD